MCVLITVGLLLDFYVVRGKDRLVYLGIYFLLLALFYGFEDVSGVLYVGVGIYLVLVWAC